MGWQELNLVFRAVWSLMQYSVEQTTTLGYSLDFRALQGNHRYPRAKVWKYQGPDGRQLPGVPRTKSTSRPLSISNTPEDNLNRLESPPPGASVVDGNDVRPRHHTPQKG